MDVWFCNLKDQSNTFVLSFTEQQYHHLSSVKEAWKQDKQLAADLAALRKKTICQNLPSMLPRFTTSGEGLCCERDPKESRLKINNTQ